ncbi:Mic19 family protein [Aspergillus candidus]|uniref:DUF1690-domain-containing protein n=1 Tax=Aspergillus candidus TaxID=41067 RepID=A0A2I2EYV6_ASPCN|nr:hypothetical protein BDW47DRAFT_113752 [Aspergillus candidus]PLB33550.1 hypothetical protein BDW47DRAFT_113752 [Aspergillus candidus]
MTNHISRDHGGSRLLATLSSQLDDPSLSEQFGIAPSIALLHSFPDVSGSRPESVIRKSRAKKVEKTVQFCYRPHIMGSGSSKPEATAGSKHIFSSGSPVQFSSNLVDSLQSSSETDSSRAKSLELQIQARVSQELERIRAREQQTVAEIEKRIAQAPENNIPAAPSSSTTTYSYPPGSLNLDAPRIPFAGRETDAPAFDTAAAAASQGQPINRGLTRDSVNEDVEQLRAKLEGRRKLVELDDGLVKAKEDVVSCLRLNDRRPLDCWKEVEGFKKEVARMEQAFVDRVVG